MTKQLMPSLTQLQPSCSLAAAIVSNARHDSQRGVVCCTACTQGLGTVKQARGMVKLYLALHHLKAGLSAGDMGGAYTSAASGAEAKSLPDKGARPDRDPQVNRLCGYDKCWVFVLYSVTLSAFQSGHFVMCWCCDHTESRSVLYQQWFYSTLTHSACQLQCPGTAACVSAWW
jgi:hypothetical protein